MISDRPEDYRRSAVYAVNIVSPCGPVFYASLPCGPAASETLKGCAVNRAGQKNRLASSLWDHLLEQESPLWKRCQLSTGSAFPVQVVRGLLGRPHLLVGEYQGPAISFSEGGGKIWAALCGDESDIGIDVAAPHEFQGDYPFHRVFHPQELQYALRVTEGNLDEASALLWSIKEAAVKALGCGFHLVDPLQITVYTSTGDEVGRAIAEDRGLTFSVGLSGKALARVPLAVGSLWVRSLPYGKMWLSIALLNRRPAGQE